MTKIFREAGYIESLGSGFPTIFNTFRKAGLEKPQVMEGVEFVKCILPRSAVGDTGSRTHDIILSLFAAKDIITKRDVIQAANISSATATRLLTQLTKDKNLQRHGAGPKTYYTAVSAGL